MEMKPAGRRSGQLRNIRDSRGWMIPRTGTKRRGVYDGLVLGLSCPELADGLKLTRRAVHAHKAYITNWRQVHQWRKASELRESEG